MLAYSFWDFLWSALVVFFFVMYLMMLFTVVMDIFRRDNTSGGKKALWLLFLLFLPLIGLLAYLILNADDMARRQMKDQQQAKAEFDSYVQTVAGGSADQIAKAKELLDAGAISQEEFDQLKAKALA